MKKQRLLKLADLLERVPAENFTIKRWVEHEGGPFNAKAPGSCGFAGCAMGWAAHAKLFPDLRVASGYGYELAHDGKPMPSIEAAMNTFKLEIADARRLFLEEAYRSGNPRPATVARRIRAFVKSNGSIR